MRRLVRSINPVLWVLGFALLLVVRTSDAHMHLCFDGQEPLSTLHISDTAADHHGGGESESGHQDKDVDAVNPALAKKSAQASDVGPVPVAALILFLLPPDRGIEREVTAQDPEPKLPYLFLPLLRGPPA